MAGNTCFDPHCRFQAKLASANLSLVAMELMLGIGLLVILLGAILTGINAGVIAMLCAGILGTAVAGMSAREVAAGFPGDVFIMLFGILLLLSIANLNGSVQWLVQKLVSLVRGRLVLLPWVLFLGAFLGSSMGPGVAPLRFVVGAGFAQRYKISPLMIGAMVVHGNQAGFFSPIAPYGILFSSVMERAGVTVQPLALYGTVVVFHIVLCVLAFLLLGGLRLVRQPAVSFQNPSAAESEDAARPIQWMTIAGFVVLAVGALLTDVNLGFMALGISFVLLLFSRRETSELAIAKVAWSVLMIICGITLYVHVLQEAGVVTAMADRLAGLGSVNLVALLIAWLSGTLTAIASTFGTLSVLLPISTPFLIDGALPVSAFLSLVGVSAAVTDISPFSPWGALFLASCAGLDRDRLFRQMVVYTLAMVVLVPPVAWLLLIGI